MICKLTSHQCTRQGSPGLRLLSARNDPCTPGPSQPTVQYSSILVESSSAALYSSVCTGRYFEFRGSISSRPYHLLLVLPERKHMRKTDEILATWNSTVQYPLHPQQEERISHPDATADTPRPGGDPSSKQSNNTPGLSSPQGGRRDPSLHHAPAIQSPHGHHPPQRHGLLRHSAHC